MKLKDKLNEATLSQNDILEITPIKDFENAELFKWSVKLSKNGEKYYNGDDYDYTGSLITSAEFKGEYFSGTIIVDKYWDNVSLSVKSVNTLKLSGSNRNFLDELEFIKSVAEWK